LLTCPFANHTHRFDALASSVFVVSNEPNPIIGFAKSLDAAMILLIDDVIQVPALL
jgi:hypothetical protein